MKKRLLFMLMLNAAAIIHLNAQVYKDINASPRERAESIVKEMTLDEKISLMRYESPAIPRLGIKQYNWWNEALHGVSRAGTATVFPQPIGMAATFDDRLVYDVFTAVSDEARAKHHKAKKEGPLKIYQGLTFWTPNVNIYRDPRWGRGHETYGEDPYLTSRMGVSVVRGLQGDNYEGGAFDGKTFRHYKTSACAKHYAVHSGPEWSRHNYDAKDISQRDLRETYLPSFKALVQKAGVQEVMCAYNRYEGEPCCGSNRLLQKILRDEWGYKGVVVTDCWALDDFYFHDRHHTEPDAEHAVAKAVRAGTDLECGQSFGALNEAVRQGLVTEDEINRAVIRLMTARYELGEMDPDSTVEWAGIPYSIVDCQKHKDLALDVARKSLVLLKNDGILPLRKDMRIGIIGPNANDSVMQWGNYNGFPSHTTTLLAALKKRLPESQLVYVPGIDHVANVKLESLFGQTTAPSGKPGLDARFWKTFPASVESTPHDVEFHYSTPLQLTTAGATVWAPDVPLAGFKAEMTTTFHADRTEDIIFSVQSQGTLELFVDGNKVYHGNNTKATNAYTFRAEAGKDYAFRLLFTATEGEMESLNFDFGRTVPLDVDRITKTLADCDAVIFAGGLSPLLEGEEMSVEIPGFKRGDRTTIELPEVQSNLIAKLHEAGKQVVLVNFSGSCVSLTKEQDMANAVLQAWYPGQDGGTAVADVLFGDYNPSGRLPLTFFRSTADLPDIEDYNIEEGGRTYRYFKGNPLYHFGYGLSYTKFEYGKAKIKKKGENYLLTVPVTNKGDRAGDEIVQVYLSYPRDTFGPSRALRAYKRITLQPGKTEKVEITLTPEQFEWFDYETSRMKPLTGEYIISYGPSSDPKQLKTISVNR